MNLPMTYSGLPHMTGAAVIPLMMAAQSASPAVALSENARSEDRTKSIRAAFQNHLAKPVEPSELLAIVGSLAGSEGRNFK